MQYFAWLMHDGSVVISMNPFEEIWYKPAWSDQKRYVKILGPDAIDPTWPHWTPEKSTIAVQTNALGPMMFVKEFDTIARLETQSIDAYNDAHQYRSGATDFQDTGYFLICVKNCVFLQECRLSWR